MPVLQVWGLPVEIEPGLIEVLHNDLIAAVQGIEELNLGPGQVTIFYPSDRLHWGIEDEIIIFVRGLFTKPERTKEVRNRLAQEIGLVLKRHFPEILIECFVESFNLQEGFWSSAEP